MNNAKSSAKNDVTIIRQCVGLDISKKTMACCFQFQDSNQDLKVKASKSFNNNSSGFQALHEWIQKWANPTIQIRLVMEATGVYYESVAHYLHEQFPDALLSVILPNTAKAFAQSMNLKSKTDKIDAQFLAQFGLERKLIAWKCPLADTVTLKKLTRERVMLQKEKTVITNQLHAENHSYGTAASILKRYEARLAFVNQQIQEIEKEILEIIRKSATLSEKVKKICTIPGVGVITAITIIAETNSFEHFNNHKQLASYAGYDVVEYQSGTINGKTRISKKGNAYIRKALHFPAIVHVRQNGSLKSNFDGIVARRQIKMKGYVGVQRKLLCLIYTIHETQEDYNPNFEQQKREKIEQEKKENAQNGVTDSNANPVVEVTN
jgi:transposase